MTRKSKWYFHQIYWWDQVHESFHRNGKINLHGSNIYFYLFYSIKNSSLLPFFYLFLPTMNKLERQLSQITGSSHCRTADSGFCSPLSLSFRNQSHTRPAFSSSMATPSCSDITLNRFSDDIWNIKWNYCTSHNYIQAQEKTMVRKIGSWNYCTWPWNRIGNLDFFCHKLVLY